MDTVSSRPGESGTQLCGNQQSHVKFDYWKQPRCSSGGGDQEGHEGDGVLQDAKSVLMLVHVPGPCGCR